MNQVVVYYNPYLPELKISVNGKMISRYSALMSFRHQRLEQWCDSLFAELYREVNSDYEVLCVSNEFSCAWLGELAQRNSHCLGFESQPLPLGASVYERLEKLELLGYEEQKHVVIPVLNASNDEAMTSAVYEILEEQGVFADASPEGVSLYDCPLITVELRTCRYSEDIPRGSPFALVLCSKEDDYINLNGDLPVYALVMGTEVSYLGRQNAMAMFSIDPDEIGNVILNIIAEEALCPLLSQMSYRFPADAMALLTESEREDLQLVCAAAPVCNVSLPEVCDLGRNVKLEIQVIPGDAETPVRVESDEQSVLTVVDDILMPAAVGTAEIAVFVGSDPYPVASEMIRVRQRKLIADISLFPSALCMPEAGSGSVKVTVAPADAENTDEIRWESSDSSVASVDSQTGEITAHACGRCQITALTQEASESVWLEVQPEIEDIVLPGSYVELGVGEQKPWRYQVLPENAYGADTLRVISSDKNIADYRGGYVIGKGIGECRIFIKTQNGSHSRELRVTVRRGRRAW